MAETDFTLIGAAAADVARGVTAGFTPPSGGGIFTFGFDSLVSEARAVGLYYNKSGFAPLTDDDGDATGGSARACLKRNKSVAATGFSVGLFLCLQGTTENDMAYILGLADDDPSAIVLAKTSLIAGLDPAASTVLRTSSETFTWDTWLDVRLDAIVNPNGDVVLKCMQNDLVTNPCNVPVWEEIGGMTDFIDDSLSILSGSAPLAGGYGGWFFQSEAIGARGLVDYFELYRQM